MIVMNQMVAPQAQERNSGPGHRFKGFEAGEIIKLWAKWNKLREGPGITITHIEYQEPVGMIMCYMIMVVRHSYKLTEERAQKNVN
jgi:hypothetical protein